MSCANSTPSGCTTVAWSFWSGCMRFETIARLLRFAFPLRKSLQEAAEQTLGKRNKLQTFNDLTMASDLRELAADEREAVRQFKAQKMGITSGAKPANNDAWVCDDMTINAGGRSNFVELLLVLLLGAGGMYLYSLKNDTPPPVPQPAEPPPAASIDVLDSEYEVRFYDKDGNPITVPHISQKVTP